MPNKATNSKAHTSVVSVVKTDLTILKKYVVTTYLLWIPIGAAVNVIQGACLFSLSTVVLAGAIGAVMQLGTADEVTGNFQLMRLTFPNTRAQIQAGHFISVAITIVAGWLVGVFSALISYAVMVAQDKASQIIWGLSGELVYSLVIFGATLILAALLLLCLAKFGFAKGFTYVPFALVLLIFLVMWLITPGSPLGDGPSNAIIHFVTDATFRLQATGVILACSTALYVLAAWASTKFYQRRQF